MLNKFKKNIYEYTGWSKFHVTKVIEITYVFNVILLF